MNNLAERQEKIGKHLNILLDNAMAGDFEGVLHQAKEIRIIALEDRIELSKSDKEKNRLEKELHKLTYN